MSKIVFKDTVGSYGDSAININLFYMWEGLDGELPVRSTGYQDNYPLICRGITNVVFYDKRKLLTYGVNYKFNNPIREKVNIILVIKNDYLEFVKNNLTLLNSFNKKLNIPEDDIFILTELDWQIPKLPNHKCYKLNGNIIWQSSAAIVSFFLGVLRFNNTSFLGAKLLSPHVLYTYEDFIEEYSKSPLCTNNLDKVKEEWAKNYDALLGERGSHNLGAAYFIAKKWPEFAYKK